MDEDYDFQPAQISVYMRDAGTDCSVNYTMSESFLLLDEVLESMTSAIRAAGFYVPYNKTLQLVELVDVEDETEVETEE